LSKLATVDFPAPGIPVKHITSRFKILMTSIS
jgi:hypothetical protein